MGLLDFMWNAGQDSEIDSLKDDIKKLQEDLETARMWIEHMNKQIEILKNEYTKR